MNNVLKYSPAISEKELLEKAGHILSEITRAQLYFSKLLALECVRQSLRDLNDAISSVFKTVVHESSLVSIVVACAYVPVAKLVNEHGFP
jgi:hypothetical protein